jgi:hypothetical protein
MASPIILCPNRGTTVSAALSMLLMRHERQSNVVTSRAFASTDRKMHVSRTEACRHMPTREASRSALARKDDESFPSICAEENVKRKSGRRGAQEQPF